MKAWLLLFTVLFLAGGPTWAETGSQPRILVYKSPTCGCCGKWEDHLRNAGFQVISRPVDNMPLIKRQYGVPTSLQSCHTALVDGYVIEGHVPAKDILRLLKEKPDAIGLTAPGMPQRSPGMQPEGMEPVGYDVIRFGRGGATEVFTRY